MLLRFRSADLIRWKFIEVHFDECGLKANFIWKRVYFGVLTSINRIGWHVLSDIYTNMDREQFVNGDEIVDYWGYLKSVSVSLFSMLRVVQSIQI